MVVVVGGWLILIGWLQVGYTVVGVNYLVIETLLFPTYM